MKKKILRKLSKIAKRSKKNYHCLSHFMSKDLKDKLKCSVCKGSGILSASNYIPKCINCGGSGFNPFKKKPKNHIDNVMAEIAKQKPSKKSIAQLKRELEKITGLKIK